MRRSLPRVPDHQPWVDLWIAWADDPPAATESLGGFLNELVTSLNLWVSSNKLTPDEMVKGIRMMNGAWLKYCAETDGYGPSLPSRPGHVASPAEWTWLAVMAQQGPFTRGLLKRCNVRPDVLKFLTNPDTAPMPAHYGTTDNHRLVIIEQLEQKTSRKRATLRVRHSNNRLYPRRYRTTVRLNPKFSMALARPFAILQSKLMEKV